MDTPDRDTTSSHNSEVSLIGCMSRDLPDKTETTYPQNPDLMHFYSFRWSLNELKCLSSEMDFALSLDIKGRLPFHSKTKRKKVNKSNFLRYSTGSPRNRKQLTNCHICLAAFYKTLNVCSKCLVIYIGKKTPPEKGCTWDFGCSLLYQ